MKPSRDNLEMGWATLPSRAQFDAGITQAYEAGVWAGKQSVDAQALHAELAALDPAQRKRRLAELDREVAQSRQDQAKLQRQLIRLRALLDAHDELSSISSRMCLERPTSSAMHRLRQSLGTGFFISRKNNRPASAPLEAEEVQEYENIFGTAHTFVVQHDWAAAFKGAADYESAVFRLPFEVCSFEFRVSGHAVIILATEADEIIYLQLAAEARTGWFSFEKAVAFGDDLNLKYQCGSPNPISSLMGFLRPQIKALAVALDARIAETEVVRAPNKLNQARAKVGRPPISDYHIVSLAARERAKRAPDPQRAAIRRRLHFRRGHWRHFEAYKTWIRWTLVGDPDLGFVDKEYRL